MLPNSVILLRLCLAAFLGSIIGLERERYAWAAGLRTHMLVCVGACLLIIISAFGFFDIIKNEHVSLDPSRIAAQVVSGIGFLGAGAILLRGEMIRGLTTAASIWAVAGIGLAAGSGLYFAAIATTTLIIGILAGIKPLEEKFRVRKTRCTLYFQVPHREMSLDLFMKTIGEHTALVHQFIIEQSDTSNTDDITVIFSKIHRKTIATVIELLSQKSGVTNIKEVDTNRG